MPNFTPLTVVCPRCSAAPGERCHTPSGKDSLMVHRDRVDSYRSRIRRDPFEVRILHDDARLGLKAGETYRAIAYRLDPEKVSLVSRIGDQYDPQCNQYVYEVEFIGWIKEVAHV